MKYTVLWVMDAESELARLWLDAVPEQRRRVTIAANEIDHRLRIDPQAQGESRGETMRILLVPPLGVKYGINDEDRLVRVLNVWDFKPR